jgi:hypothetical protein
MYLISLTQYEECRVGRLAASSDISFTSIGLEYRHRTAVWEGDVWDTGSRIYRDTTAKKTNCAEPTASARVEFL